MLYHIDNKEVVIGNYRRHERINRRGDRREFVTFNVYLDGFVFNGLRVMKQRLLPPISQQRGKYYNVLYMNAESAARIRNALNNLAPNTILEDERGISGIVYDPAKLAKWLPESMAEDVAVD